MTFTLAISWFASVNEAFLVLIYIYVRTILFVKKILKLGRPRLHLGILFQIYDCNPSFLTRWCFVFFDLFKWVELKPSNSVWWLITFVVGWICRRMVRLIRMVRMIWRFLSICNGQFVVVVRVGLAFILVRLQNEKVNFWKLIYLWKIYIFYKITRTLN